MPSQPALPIHEWPLAYVSRLEQRALEAIDLVVIHCTELPDLAMAREFGERVLYDSGSGNSGHFYLDRDGAIHRFVPPERIAHHVRGFNPRAVGIELVNLGRYPHWLDSRHQDMDEAYPTIQIDALMRLLDALTHTLPSLRWIAGHEDLDRATVEASDDPGRRVPRKRDPGPRFPWDQLLANTRLARFMPDA
ncbi:MAG TPA: N-acetylmuramoyl-L-alanine amidase [Chiayiivirga sp.]|nr:N-acetylmuramoyl-L-alanine amidase [Chiayiivirga sp.]